MAIQWSHVQKLLMCLVATDHDGNGFQLETWGRFFQVFAQFCILDKISKNWFGLFFFSFQNSFDFVSLVVWKQFMHEQGTLI